MGYQGGVERDRYTEYDLCPGLPGDPRPCNREKQANSELCLICSARKRAQDQEQPAPMDTAEMQDRHHRLQVALEIGVDVETLKLLCELDMLPTWEELGGEALCSTVWQQWHPGAK